MKAVESEGTLQDRVLIGSVEPGMAFPMENMLQQ